MAISLNKIVGILSDRVGKPFNIPLQEELKEIIKYKRANYMQQFIEKHPEQRNFFTQQFVTKVDKVDSMNDMCGLSTPDCPLLETTCEVPQPLRNSYALFDYVGQPDFSQAYRYGAPEFNAVAKYNKYTSRTPSWYYSNDKIYVYNTLTTRSIGVRGIFTNPEEVNNCCEGPACFDDDASFPMPEDLLNSIVRDILNVELRNIFPMEYGEVTVDKDTPSTIGK
jgi:hypothetical protein